MLLLHQIPTQRVTSDHGRLVRADHEVVSRSYINPRDMASVLLQGERDAASGLSRPGAPSRVRVGAWRPTPSATRSGPSPRLSEIPIAQWFQVALDPPYCAFSVLLGEGTGAPPHHVQRPRETDANSSRV